jgi:4-hydroxymandelate oxidase
MQTSTLSGLRDYQLWAESGLSEQSLAYVNGGAADEHTSRGNESAWQSIRLRPRVLQDIRDGSTAISMLGRTWPAPLMVAPMAMQAAVHFHAEAGLAMAAAAQGWGFALSHQSSTSLEDVARRVVAQPGRGPLWFQLYVYRDHGVLTELIRRAEAANYEALVITVDAPVHGVRDREMRVGMPLEVTQASAHGPVLSSPLHGKGLCAGLADVSATWKDIAWVQTQTKLPVILKGITHPVDARMAVKAQISAVIVSNHGGRTLDTMPATAQSLEAVVQAVQGDCPILVDGGVRRGTDVFKAISMGASAVLVGRPCLWGLAHQGALGAAHICKLLRDELEMAMALMGCSNIASIERSHTVCLSKELL